MKNFKVTVEYDGSKYSGWQRQGNTTNTIQYKFEDIINKMLGVKTEIFASGRTDSGVHAKGQVFNFKCETKMECRDVKDYINRYLPYDIRVLCVEEMDDRFHSRLNAQKKTYCYRMCFGDKLPVFERKYITLVENEPDVELMRIGAAKLLGKHDFKGFSTKSGKKSTVREIYEIDINAFDDMIELIITGNGFLYNMVRIIAGTLYEIGIGRRNPESIDEILKNKDRALAGVTMPPEGLCLLKVYY